MLNYLYYFLPYVKGLILHLFSVTCCPQTRPEFRVRDKDQDPGRNIPEPYIHSLDYSLSLMHRNTYTPSYTHRRTGSPTHSSHTTKLYFREKGIVRQFVPFIILSLLMFSIFFLSCHRPVARVGPGTLCNCVTYKARLQYPEAKSR